MTGATTVVIVESVLHYVGLGLASALLAGIGFAWHDLRQIVREAAPAPRRRR